MGGDGAIPFDERLGTGHWLHARGVEQARPAIVLPRYQVRQNHGGGGAVADAPGSEASRDQITFSTRRRPTDERPDIPGSIVLTAPAKFDRSEERSVEKAGVSQCRSGGPQSH